MLKQEARNLLNTIHWVFTDLFSTQINSSATNFKFSSNIIRLNMKERRNLQKNLHTTSAISNPITQIKNINSFYACQLDSATIQCMHRNSFWNLSDRCFPELSIVLKIDIKGAWICMGRIFYIIPICFITFISIFVHSKWLEQQRKRSF